MSGVGGVTEPSLSLPCAPEALDEFLSAPSSAVLEFARSLTGPVLVLGAGGKMGLHLCLMLHRAVSQVGVPAQVIAVSRFTTLRDRAAFSQAGIKTLVCDLSDPSQVAQLPDAENVYFLAGLKFGTANAPEQLHRANILMPRLVAARYRNARIVAFSTGCVYPFVPVTSRGASEATLPAPVGDYAVSCLGREEEFGSAALTHGTRVVLIRLNYAVEFRYGVLVDIATKVRSDASINLNTGHVNVIWQRDAVDQIIRTLPFAHTPALPLNITGPDVLTLRQIAEDFGRLFGREPKFVGEEAKTAWLNDAALSHRLLGSPQIGLATMERWIAAWLESQQETWGKPTGFENRDGKF